MDIRKIYDAFGRCYNIRDFGGMTNLLSDDVVYDSYDCIYKVTSFKDVVKVLSESTKENSSAYSGYYMQNGMFVKRLTQCVLICDDSTLKCTRLVSVKIKKGKIALITGYEPNEYDFTRGKKIDG